MGPPGLPQAFHATPTFDLQGEASKTPRSVVVISMDTVSAQHLAIYGGRALTPRLAQLARRGVRFDQAISLLPETCLSHWSMWTGVPPEGHGDAPAVHGSRSTVPTVAEIASRAGYATAAFIGGATLTDSACGFGRGFDHVDDQFPLDRSDLKRPGTEVTQRAVAWISQQSGPYLAFVHYFDAHFPYTPGPPWDTRYDPDYTGQIDGSDRVLRPYRDGQKTPTAADIAHVSALYDGELSELDAALGPLLDAAGPDTVVLVTADHGESFGHGYWFNHRAGLWDEVLRVPLLVAAPGLPAGSVVQAQVGLIDVAPTVLALAGLPVDRRIAGHSLVPLIQGSGQGRATVFSTTDPARKLVQRAARTATRKVILQPGSVLQYDLSRDPLEQRDLGEQGVDRAALVAGYQALVKPFLADLVPAPVPPALTPEERARLGSLGYLPPAGAPPAGRPPG
ncbi:MAG: sulfatase [Oligoflexia bacterium]|nr:sulfatase [Oligoflexia bacterium]